MNKKIKKILATVSAVAMCAVSATFLSSGAVYVLVDNLENTEPYIHNGIPYYGIHIDTQSFYVGGVKYTRWEKGTEYFQKRCSLLEPVLYINDENQQVFATTDMCIATLDQPLTSQCREVSVIHFSKSFYLEKDKADILEKFLSENDINYTIEKSEDSSTYIFRFPDAKTWDDFIDIANPIYENTGIGVYASFPESMVTATNIEIALPEPTLSGDANNDGKVSLADAVLIMQALSNPDEYQITPQGMANADIDGDGLTPTDAAKIQQMVLNS
ncbi:MAG: dockerin type I repeat-containing protein [Ruminococcus sp.]|nr:dockerin type I repeat-containing protein [Ruminococcus sp.]